MTNCYHGRYIYEGNFFVPRCSNLLAKYSNPKLRILDHSSTKEDEDLPLTLHPRLHTTYPSAYKKTQQHV